MSIDVAHIYLCQHLENKCCTLQTIPTPSSYSFFEMSTDYTAQYCVFVLALLNTEHSTVNVVLVLGIASLEAFSLWLPSLISPCSYPYKEHINLFLSYLSSHRGVGDGQRRGRILPMVFRGSGAIYSNSWPTMPYFNARIGGGGASWMCSARDTLAVLTVFRGLQNFIL